MSPDIRPFLNRILVNIYIYTSKSKYTLSLYIRNFLLGTHHGEGGAGGVAVLVGQTVVRCRYLQLQVAQRLRRGSTALVDSSPRWSRRRARPCGHALVTNRTRGESVFPTGRPMGALTCSTWASWCAAGRVPLADMPLTKGR
eukprot:1190311-Prorocentrum_minimum.AAC.1